MITALDSVAAAVWRASWQAAVLALLVVILLRCCGERLAPRWRFLLWSVVVLRLLFVATPASPWSVFNLVCRKAAPISRDVATREADSLNSPEKQSAMPNVRESNDQHENGIDSASIAKSEPAAPAAQNIPPANAHSVLPVVATESATIASKVSYVGLVGQILRWCWL